MLQFGWTFYIQYTVGTVVLHVHCTLYSIVTHTRNDCAGSMQISKGVLRVGPDLQWENLQIRTHLQTISFSAKQCYWFNKPKVPCCVYSISCSSTEYSKNMLVPRVLQSERYRTRARTLALSKSQSISVINLKPMCLGQYLCCLHFATYYRNRSMYTDCTVQFTVSALVGTLVCKAYFPTRGGTLRNMERGIWRHARAWRSTLGICILSGRGRHAYNNLKYIGGTLRSIYCNVAARYVV